MEITQELKGLRPRDFWEDLLIRLNKIYDYEAVKVISGEWWLRRA